VSDFATETLDTAKTTCVNPLVRSVPHLVGRVDSSSEMMSRAGNRGMDAGSRLGQALAAGAVVAFLCGAAAGLAESQTLPNCTFANGLQTGPSPRVIPGGVIVSLYIENTRGRADCRFRSTVTLTILHREWRWALRVTGNPSQVRVDRIVPKRSVLRISWVWRNWCNAQLTAVGTLKCVPHARAVPQYWKGRFRSPACINRGRGSTLTGYSIETLGR
jgi:hypothetical protein